MDTQWNSARVRVMASGARSSLHCSAALLFAAHLGQDLQICLGGFGDSFRVSGIDGGQVDQVAAHA